MSSTLEYAIGLINNDGTRYYTGKTESNGHKPGFTPDLKEAKHYADQESLCDDIGVLRAFACAIKVLEIQECPKCKKLFTEHPAISRDDDETEICPDCGVSEAIDAYVKACGADAD